MTHVMIENKGIDFESPWDNVEVAVKFKRLVENGSLSSDFALSLYEGGKRSGKLTARQIAWVHVIVAQHEGIDIDSSKNLGGFELIHEHLANCRKSRDNGGKGLLNPVVSLTVGDQTVALKLAGARSRNAGKVSVASDHRFGFGDFYGWISSDGSLESRGGVPEAVVEILRRVAVAPSVVISEIGKESGRCCYCLAELSTVQSKIAGAGRKCSENYGVFYPNTQEARDFIKDHPEVLDGASDFDRWV